MKPITAMQMRHLANEITATRYLLDHEKAESPMVSEIMYLQISKEIMEAALDGKHETRFVYNDEFDTVVYDVIKQFRDKDHGYTIEKPSYSNHIQIKW